MFQRGDNQSDTAKLTILVHELTHRLLSGNGLGDTSSKTLSNLELHKRIYLFEYDVVEAALGHNIAEEATHYETSHAMPNYERAWRWAMSKPYAERQGLVREMASRRIIWK